MERYFDTFLYLANWGTRRLMFRFPRVGAGNSVTLRDLCIRE